MLYKQVVRRRLDIPHFAIVARYTQAIAYQNYLRFACGVVELLQKLPKNLVLLSYIVDTQHHNEVSIVCIVLVYYKVLDVEWFAEKGNWGLVRTVTESRLIYKRQRQLLFFRLLPMLCKQLLMSRPHITHSLVKKVIIFRTPNLRRADEIL